MTFYVATEGKPPTAFDTEDEANAHAKTLAGKPVVWELTELNGENA